MREIGKNIKYIREAKQMTQDDLAAKLFVSRQTISNYETGRTKPDIDMLTKMSSALETDIHVFIYGPPKILTRSRSIKRLCVFGIISVLMIIGNYCFSGWAIQTKTTNYDLTPTYLLNIIYKPIMFCVIGYTIMQYLGTFHKIRPLKDTGAQRVKKCTFVIILIYIMITYPLAFSQLLPFNIPSWWFRIAFVILGALPAQQGSGVYLAIASVIGALLWMCDIIPNENVSSDDIYW